LIGLVIEPETQIELCFFGDCKSYFLSQVNTGNVTQTSWLRMPYSEFSPVHTGKKISAFTSFIFCNYGYGTPTYDFLQSIQISERFNCYDFPQKYVQSLSRIKKVSITHSAGISEIVYLTQVESLELFDLPYLKTISDLANLRTLIISCCPNLEEISKASKLSYVEMLYCDGFNRYEAFHACKYIQLIQQRQVNLLLFPNVRTLSLSTCSIMKNFRLPRTVRCLKLGDPEKNFFKKDSFLQCEKLEIAFSDLELDWKILRNIKCLVLRNCSKLTSLSVLVGGKIENLTVSSCQNIRDFSSLSFIPQVELSCFRSLPSKLRYPKGILHLKLVDCVGIQSLQGFEDIPTLEVNCRQDMDFKPLLTGKNEKLVLLQDRKSSSTVNRDQMQLVCKLLQSEYTTEAIENNYCLLRMRGTAK
jgi:hypothetical protein